MNPEEIMLELKKAFEAFKAENNAALAELKAKGSVDPLLTGKIEKINARITELDEIKSRMDSVEAKANRPGGFSGASEDASKAEHSKAFYGNFIRKGNDSGLTDLEKKAMNIATPGDGGYAVPTELDKTIIELALDANVMRQICNVVTIGTSDYKKLVNTHGAVGGWVGEADSRAATATPTLAEITPYLGEIYANPMATQQSLDDMFFNVEAFLANEISNTFAAYEETAFVSGSGTKQPKGFLAYAQADTVDASRAFGTLQYLYTGASGAFKTVTASVSQADDLIDLVGSLKASMLPGATFLMNRLTQAAIRKFKDYTGEYIWQPSLQAGTPNTLLGYNLNVCEAMPAIGAGSIPIAFGNFKAGYTIVDRMGTRVLRDPFSAKPYVTFYTTKRVGGMVADSNAIKLLKLSTS